MSSVSPVVVLIKKNCESLHIWPILVIKSHIFLFLGDMQIHNLTHLWKQDCISILFILICFVLYIMLYLSIFHIEFEQSFMFQMIKKWATLELISVGMNVFYCLF